MINEKSTLADVCFEVSAALAVHGMSGVLVGGSAAAVYAPAVYMSHDADFILDGDDPLQQIAIALRSIGYERQGRGRLFANSNSPFTVDFPKGPLAVGGDYVRETHVIERGKARLRILTRFDCVRDRLAHFYHWDDYTALNAAVGVAAHDTAEVDLNRLRAWTKNEGAHLLAKFTEFEKRLRLAKKQQVRRTPLSSSP